MSLFDSGLITYDKSTAEEILSIFIEDIDEEGYVTEDGVRVRALDGGTIKKDEIAGMIDGKFIRNTLPALIEVVDLLKERLKEKEK